MNCMKRKELDIMEESIKKTSRPLSGYQYHTSPSEYKIKKAEPKDAYRTVYHWDKPLCSFLPSDGLIYDAQHHSPFLFSDKETEKKVQTLVQEYIAYFHK